MMKKKVTQILMIIILVVLAVIALWTFSKRSKETFEAQTTSQASTEAPVEASVEFPTPTEEAPSTSIARLTLSGSEFPTMTLGLAHEQNGIILSYDLTTDILDHVDVSSNSFDKLVNALPDFKVDRLIAEDVTDLSAYGLDQPKLHLIIDFYNANLPLEEGATPAITSTFDFIWGNELEDGKIAFMKTGEKGVYAMDASFLSDLKELATPFNLSSKFIQLPNIALVKTIDIAYTDATYHIDVDETHTTYALNNHSIEKDAFKALYRSVIGIYAEFELDTPSQESTPEVTITYTLVDGSTRVATFAAAADPNYYQTMLHGNMLVGCSKAQLDTLKATLEEALHGAA